MAAWLLWFLPSFEAGFWSALIAGKLRDRGKTRELLVYGRPARTCLPVIDERLRKADEIAGFRGRTDCRRPALACQHAGNGLRNPARTKAGLAKRQDHVHGGENVPLIYKLLLIARAVALSVSAIYKAYQKKREDTNDSDSV
jgi:hypothetical protein